MEERLSQILNLEVPVIVRLAERDLPLSEVLAMVQGMIIELPKSAGDELELMINNKPIGTGTAVKVGENFGIRLSFLGDVRERIEALGNQAPKSDDDDVDFEGELDTDVLAEQMLAGQL
ncbi:MAG: FliM/FliN family flagellar motor switch protein [Planctomycetota bacterium]